MYRRHSSATVPPTAEPDGRRRVLFLRVVGLLLVLFAPAPVSAAPSPAAAIVTNNAFLLSLTPDISREGVRVHSLVGYLPAGTVISVGEERVINNLTRGEEETYSAVVSETGFSGLLRSDLFVRVNRRPLVVSTASYDIPIHQPNATLSSPRIRFHLGRFDGNYLEITGESEEGFYDVLLDRTSPSPTLPATEAGRLKKSYERQGQVSIVRPGSGEELVESFALWQEGSPIVDRSLAPVLDTLSERADKEVQTIKAFLGDINNLQCVLASSANGEVGFKVFSNGFSVNLDVALKEANMKYGIATRKLLEGSKETLYTDLSVIRCNGLQPERLLRFTLQEGLFSLERRMSVRLEDLEASRSPWVTTLQGSEVPNKMVRISGWPEYNQMLRELDRLAMGGAGYLSTLPGRKRMLLLNYILSRIAYFEYRDLVTNDGL